MAGKKIDGGTVVVDGKGNMKQLNKELNKTSKGFNTLDKNAQSADRGMKGASNMSSNATKNFSKLSQGISGGLVPAYATLAANLFAIDAVFRFLKDAADFRVLKEGQLAFAAATGVAYQSLARDLQSATQGMINFRDAAQAGAIGRAAGLSAGQLTELSEAAFKVSVALGRDVTDSFNRLVRGVTKAEPELLDELGIVLRLEEATTKYAAALGLNKNQLSIYQKSQAVVNEVLDQTERKFGRIDAIMNPQANALAQLGVAFEEVVDQIKAFIAPFAEGIGKFATENIEVITMAILGFGAGIINSVIPSVAALQEAQTAQTVAHRAELERLDGKYQQLQARKQALASTPISQQNFMAETGAMGIDIGGSAGETLKAGGVLTPQQRGNLRSQLNRKGGPIGAFKGATKAQQKSLNKLFDSMKKDAGGKSLKGAQLQLEEFFLSGQIGANKAGQGFKSFTNVVSKGARKLMMVFSGLMTAVAIFSVLFVAFKAVMSFFNKEKEARLAAYNKKINEATKSQERFNLELTKMAEVSQKGLLDTLTDKIEHTGEAVASANLPELINNFNRMSADAEVNQEAFDKFSDEVLYTFNRLAELDDGFKSIAEEFRNTGEISDVLKKKIKELNDVLLENNAAVKNIRETEGELIKANNRLVQSLPKAPFQDIRELLLSQSNSMQTLIDNGQDFVIQQDAVNARLEVFNALARQGLKLEERKARLKRQSGLTGILSSTELQKQVAIEQKRIAVAGTLNEFNAISIQLATSGVDLESEKGRQLKEQLRLKGLLLEQQQIELDMATLTSDRGFQLVDSLYGGLQKDLAKGISGAMRGESDAFEALGKNFAKTITDSIGDMLAEQFMEDVFKDALGIEDVKDKIFIGAEYHALMVQAAIEMGGDAHATALGQKIAKEGYSSGLSSHAGAVEKVMTEGNKTLQQAIIDLTKAEISAIEAKEKAEDKRRNKIRDDQKKLIINERQARNFAGEDSPERTRAMFAFLESDLGSADSVAYKQQKDLIASLQQDLRNVQGGMGYILPPGSDESPETYIKRQIAFAKQDAVNILGRSKGLGALATSAGGKDQDPFGGLSIRGTSSINKLTEAFLNELLKDIEDNKIRYDDLEAEFMRSNITSAGLDQSKTGLAAKLTFLEGQMNQGDQPSSLTAVTGDTQGVGMFNPDGTINADFISKFNVTFDELLEAYKEAKNKAEDENETTTDKFSKNLNRFSGVIGMMGALTGEEEKTAKIMAKVAKIQLMITMYERAKMALEQGGGNFFKTIGAFMFGESGARQGGIMSQHGRSYSQGGIADGPNSGYTAMLHGREAVIPLPNGRSIPVDIGKGKMNTNNTNITVNIDDAGATSKVDGEGGKELGVAIQGVVQAELERQMRPGGLLGT